MCAGATGRVVNPKALHSSKVKVTWQEPTFWRLALDVSLSNIWFYSTRVMPLFKARRMNESGLFAHPLPSLDADAGDILYVPLSGGRKRYASKEWHQTVLAVASGGMPVTYHEDPWNEQWSSSNLVCFRNAVMSGAFAYVVRPTFAVFVCGCAGVRGCFVIVGLHVVVLA